MRAILIDPFACTVTEVDFDYKDYKSFYPLLSHEVHPVDVFTMAPNDLLEETNDSLYVDDEGLLHGPQRGFLLKGNDQILAGKGIIVGIDDEGESIDPKVTLETVTLSTTFYEFVGPLIYQTREPWKAEIKT